MYDDVIDFMQFYRSPLGQMARRVVRRRLRRIWPDVRGMEVLGAGYAVPYLRPFLGEAAGLTAVMPARRGVMAWPTDGRNRVTLADPDCLPFPDLSMDRILLAHSLERSESVTEMMGELWRVLAGGGRLLIIVPNRRGIWSRAERTPFGHGHPYSAGQLDRLLREHYFVPESTHRCLFVPPWTSRFTLAAAGAWEKVGSRWFETFGGVILVEATKQVYRIAAQKRPQRYHRPVLLPTPQSTPAARNWVPREIHDDD